jgi:hypothetical protein
MLLYHLYYINQLCRLIQYFYLSDSHYSYLHHYCGIVHYVHGLAVRSYPKESIDYCSRPIDSSNGLVKNLLELNFCCVLHYTVYFDYTYYVSGHCSPREIRISTISQTQWAFCSV